jgi:DNA-directed RNA polymerase sigma subunit (sigma70/sigma32)
MMPLVDWWAVIDSEQHAWNTERLQLLDRLLGTLLTRREEFVVRRYFGFDGEAQTALQIAEQLEISPSRIHKIKNSALRRLDRFPRRDWLLFLGTKA